MLKTETDILAMGFYVQIDKIQNQMVVIDNLLEDTFVIRASLFIGHRYKSVCSAYSVIAAGPESLIIFFSFGGLFRDSGIFFLLGRDKKAYAQPIQSLQQGLGV